MALFSLVPIFMDWTKNDTFMGLKIHRNWVLEFVDRTRHENHENWYPTKIKPSTVPHGGTDETG